MECSICLDEIKLYSYIATLRCGHSFHSVCFRMYKDQLCPLCRLPTSIYKIDSIMVNNKSLYEWSRDDFYYYIDFTRNKKEIIIEKKKEFHNEIILKKNEELDSTIRTFYKKKINEIKFNILKNIEKNKKKFTVIYCVFGDKYNNYPLVYLLNGPKNQKNYFKNKNIKSFIDHIKQDFPILNCTIKTNKDIMCYEVVVELS